MSKSDLERINIKGVRFETDPGLGSRAKIGMIILQTDQTLEHELRMMISQRDVALYHSRIPNEMEVNKETLARMHAELPKAAGLLPPSFNFNVIGYGCTSGATIIGEKAVETAVRQTHPDTLVTNPLTACKAAFRALGLKRLAILTPYSPSVTTALQRNFLDDGFEVSTIGSFYQIDDFVVGRITPQSILAAVEEIGAQTDCDGIFISCTSLRTAAIIEEAEARLGKPVTSSNHALAWHLLRLAGVQDTLPNLGTLFQKQLADQESSR